MCLWEFVNDINLYGDINIEIVVTCDCDGYIQIYEWMKFVWECRNCGCEIRDEIESYSFEPKYIIFKERTSKYI